MSEVPLYELGGSATDNSLQELLEIKDTHRPRTLRWVFPKEHRTFLGAVRVPNFE